MRFLYSLLWWLAMPLVLARLWWRGRREPGYRQHWGERLGRYPAAASNAGAAVPTLWIHAVSVGETRAAQPLIDALLQAHPAHRIVLTHMTPTGRATGAALFGHYGTRLESRYLPYDIGLMLRGFLRTYQPQVCILIETEVWPNLVAQCRRRQIPVTLVNARLSARSLTRGLRMQGLLGGAARGLTATAAQTPADAARLQQMGVAPVTVTGSIKFDVVPAPAQLAQGQFWRTQFGRRPVLLCASTREGEEEAILAALAAVPVDALLVIVPRHPQRFDTVADLISAHGLPLVRRSTMGDAPLAPSVRVVLGDSMGELFAYYTAADLAFVGGSLMPFGGQNLIEACAVGTPVLVGPSSFNFADVTDDAIAAGAALRIDDAPALLASAQALFADAAVRGAMAGAARAFAARHRGATARTMAMLEPILEPILKPTLKPRL